MSYAAEPLTISSISPFAVWLRSLPERTGKTWLEIETISGVSVDQLRRLREGRARPRARTLEALFAVFGAPDGAVEMIEQAKQRALAQGYRRRSERAKCEVCGRPELVSQVHDRDSFRPAAEGQTATFVHGWCRPRPDNPFVPALDAAKARLGGTWLAVRQALAKAGVRVQRDARALDLNRIRSARMIPKPDAVPVIAKALRFPPEDEVRWGELSRQYWEERRRAHPLGPAPTAPRATCRGGCERSKLVSQVRKMSEFDEGPPPTYLCSKCRGQRKIELVCPVVGCLSPRRFEYKSRRWKRERRDQRRDDGCYGIPCDECRQKFVGALTTPRLREALFPKFDAWFREQSRLAAARRRDRKPDPVPDADQMGSWFHRQSKSARKASAREVWAGAAPDIQFPLFERWFRSSKYAKRFSAPSVAADESETAQRQRNLERTLYRLIVKAWAKTRVADIRRLRGSGRGVRRGPRGNLQRWLRQWEQWAETAEDADGTHRAGARLTQAQTDRLTGVGRAPTAEQIDGSEPLSSSQAALLGPGTGPALARCGLCTTILNTKAQASKRGRRLHAGEGVCSGTWRRSPEYRTVWRRRRWGGAERGAPIDPPWPAWAGRPTSDKGLARKFVWFIKHHVFGQSLREIAAETMEIATAMGRPTTVSEPAVMQGISDFVRALPSDLFLAFPRPAMRRLVECALGQRRVTEDQRKKGSRLILWLGRRWRMAPAAVARLVVGFSADEVARLLKNAGTNAA